MLTAILLFLSFLNLVSIGASFYRWYQMKLRQQEEINSFTDFAQKQAETIIKAVELSNSYNNAITALSKKVDYELWTVQDNEVFNDVTMKQRNFLYHLRKLNPNYSIIKDEI